MNRRSFLARFLKSGIAIAAAPQIVTHGLKLWVPKRGISPIGNIKVFSCDMGEVINYLEYERYRPEDVIKFGWTDVTIDL